jgi:hypothetical protein
MHRTRAGGVEMKGTLVKVKLDDQSVIGDGRDEERRR